MDQIFCEEIVFELPRAQAMRCYHTTKTMAEAFAMACEFVGLELIEYDSCQFMTMPGSAVTTITGHGRLWRQRLQR